MTLCANTEYLRQHMRTVDQEERRLDAIEARTSVLMCTDFSVSEVVGDLFPEFNASVIESIGVLMRMIDEDVKAHRPAAADQPRIQLSRLIEGMTDNYRARLAKAKAEDEINGADCQRCFDAGCRFCVEAA